MDTMNFGEDFFNFITRHEGDDVARLRLKRPTAAFDVDFAITQIECRKRIRRKLPELFADSRFLFPSVLTTEQATCEAIAKYHAEILGPVPAVLDMTAGLCVDDYYIAARAGKVTSVEMNESTAAVSLHNMSRLRGNIEVIHGNSIDYITGTPTPRFDAVFIDPARRGSNQSRVYGLADCEPDVLQLLPAISAVAPVLYVKASPMLDVTQVLREVPEVSDVWVVSLRNECKELLFKVNFGCAIDAPMLHCVNITAADSISREELSLPYSASRASVQTFATAIGRYLYEPNASIMKAGAFAALASKYCVEKVAPHSHLFTADVLRADFPGRVFRVESVMPFKEKAVKAALNGASQVNVSVRNFKLTAQQLKSRLRLTDGGDRYLFGTTTAGGDMVVAVCHKAI